MKKELLSEHLRRARHDPAFRAHLLENARWCRAVAGAGALFFGCLALWLSVDTHGQGGPWFSRSSVAYAVSFLANGLLWDKFGDRLAMLRSLEEAADPRSVRDSALPEGRQPGRP